MINWTIHLRLRFLSVLFPSNLATEFSVHFSSPLFHFTRRGRLMFDNLMTLIMFNPDAQKSVKPSFYPLAQSTRMLSGESLWSHHTVLNPVKSFLTK